MSVQLPITLRNGDCIVTQTIYDVDTDTVRTEILEVHRHAWKPIEGERARYLCACGEQALKDLRTGELRETDKRVSLDPRVQPVGLHGAVDASGCGQVKRADDPEEL